MTVPDPLAAPSLRRRMAAWMYEGTLLFGVVFVSAWLFSALGQMRNAMDARRPLLQVFLFVVFAVYFAWFWHKGQTVAMKTWRIRVVDRAGRQVSQGRALLRYVLSWLWFLPPLAAIAPFHLTAGQVALAVGGWV
ncbi:MAG TPA: RDD family protein, partial [Solimonas sp.]|nr:RDD family protein [Solimonas sp.]